MKKVLFLVSLSVSVLSFQACNNSGKSSNQDADSASMANKPLSENASQFLKKAATINRLEIKLGALAQQQAGTPRIKEYAKMLTSDHTMLSNKLEVVANDKSATLPDSLDQSHQMDVQSLRKEKPSNFDKDYIDMMVKGHTGAIKAFQNAAQEIKDSSVHVYITNALPVLKKHLDSAQAIQQAMK